MLVANEPKFAVSFAKYRQVFKRAVFHIESVSVSERIPFVVEKTWDSMTASFVQFAHDLHLGRYFSYIWNKFPVSTCVLLLFDYNLLVRSLVS